MVGSSALRVVAGTQVRVCRLSGQSHIFGRVSGQLDLDMAGDRPCGWSADPISFVEPAVDTHIWHHPLLYGKFLDSFMCPRGLLLEPHSMDAHVNFGCIFSSHHLVDGGPASSFHHPPLQEPSCGALVGPSDFPSYGYIF